MEKINIEYGSKFLEGESKKQFGRMWKNSLPPRRIKRRGGQETRQRFGDNHSVRTHARGAPLVAAGIEFGLCNLQLNSFQSIGYKRIKLNRLGLAQRPDSLAGSSSGDKSVTKM